jgi:Flp pilus assembly protein CpaB
MTPRLRNVLLAALFALVAVGATLLYASRAKTQPPAAADGVRVLVAGRDIALGTTGSAILDGSLAELRVVARDDVVADAVVDPSQLRGLVATAPIYRGEQVTTRRLGTAEQEGMRAGLRGALRLVRVQGDDEQLLAGTLRDGDRVDVLASIRQPESGTSHYALVVLRNLLVVDAAKPSGGSAGTAKTALTLQLTDAQAQRLFWVEKNADWTLLLRPAAGVRASTAPAVSAGTLLGGGR